MKNKITIAGLSVLAGFALACGAGSESNTGSGGGNDGGTDTKKEQAKAAKVGQPARDGKFEFVVSGVKCRQSKIGTGPIAEKPQGEFCVIAMTVKNIGKEAQLFDGSSQKAFDAKGTEFSNDGAAELISNEGNSTFLEQINPGNSVKGNLVFDVPKGTKLTRMELHDSPFSGGIGVTLS